MPIDRVGRQPRPERDYRLSLFPYAHGTNWRLVAVTRRNGEAHYQRIAGGALPLPIRGRRGLLLDLARVVWTLRRQWGIGTEPQAPREPPGGGGGDVPLPGLGWEIEGVPLVERSLDTAPADRYHQAAPPPP